MARIIPTPGMMMLFMQVCCMGTVSCALVAALSSPSKETHCVA